MLKKINLVISSRIDNLDENGFAEGECEVSESSLSGTMKISSEELSLSYHENTDGEDVFCEIRPTSDSVTVRRTGAIVSILYFSESEDYETVYEIPPYKFDMTIKTKKIRNTLTELGGTLEIHYLMSVGGASKRAKMKISVSEASK